MQTHGIQTLPNPTLRRLKRGGGGGGGGLLSVFLYLIMRAILRLGEDAYGAMLEEHLNDRFKLGIDGAQVYHALKALERAAYVTRVLRPAPKGRENPVYVYSVTEIGGEAMKVARSFYRKALKRSP